MVSFRCFGGFGGFVPVFRWFRWFRWFRSDGFVSVFRVLVHALVKIAIQRSKVPETIRNTSTLEEGMY